MLQELDEGNVTDSWALDNVVIQRAENDRFSSSLDYLATGSLILDELRSYSIDYVPEVLHRSFNNEKGYHILSKVEGSYPETNRELYVVGDKLREFHEDTLNAEFLENFNYGQLKTNENNTELEVQDGEESWKDFLERRTGKMRPKSVSNPPIKKDLVVDLFNSWDSKNVGDYDDFNLVQNDFKPSNALITQEERVSLLDFDQSIVGDPLLDVSRGKIALEIRGIDSDSFVDGYGAEDEDQLRNYDKYSLMYEVWLSAVTDERPEVKNLESVVEQHLGNSNTS